MNHLCLIKLVWLIFLKIGRVLIDQINLMKYSKSKFKSPNFENKTPNELWVHNLKLCSLNLELEKNKIRKPRSLYAIERRPNIIEIGC